MKEGRVQWSLGFIFTSPPYTLKDFITDSIKFGMALVLLSALFFAFVKLISIFGNSTQNSESIKQQYSTEDYYNGGFLFAKKRQFTPWQ